MDPKPAVLYTKDEVAFLLGFILLLTLITLFYLSFQFGLTYIKNVSNNKQQNHPNFYKVWDFA